MEGTVKPTYLIIVCGCFNIDFLNMSGFTRWFKNITAAFNLNRNEVMCYQQHLQYAWTILFVIKMTSIKHCFGGSNI